MVESCFIKSIKISANTIGLCFSYFLPNRIPEFFRVTFSYMYTGYVRRRFLSFGKHSLIAYKAYIKGAGYISIGESTTFFRGARLAAYTPSMSQTPPRMYIGNHCEFGNNNHITCAYNICIGDNLLTGSNVLITDNAHGASTYEQMVLPPKERPLYSKGEVSIGNNVWLADNVCVLPNVHIGNNVIIAANSVVTKDIPDFTIAGGVPARVIKNEFTNDK